MNQTIVEEVLSKNFDSLKSVDEVVFFIGYLSAQFRTKVPTEVIADIHTRLQDSPNSIEYAKQQLRYLVNWITR